LILGSRCLYTSRLVAASHWASLAWACTDENARELLPDECRPTSAKWLRLHPHIQAGAPPCSGAANQLGTRRARSTFVGARQPITQILNADLEEQEHDRVAARLVSMASPPDDCTRTPYTGVSVPAHRGGEKEKKVITGDRVSSKFHGCTAESAPSAVVRATPTSPTTGSSCSWRPSTTSSCRSGVSKLKISSVGIDD
jgi:hypothetical protein